ncbi:MAG: type II toxin-antitoxin system RelE/ParE family toxin [Candidatus Methylacidiphilales bacterium]|nr:addiction module toxin RelE [Candidatus Methylacidiphilales bacterium]
MYQIIFNDTSAAELKELPLTLQLQILNEFNEVPQDLEQVDPEKFGKLERNGRKLLRYRTKEYRIYLEVVEGGLRVHRILHKNTLKDFLYRLKISTEDETLQKSPEFWEMIDRKS